MLHAINKLIILMREDTLLFHYRFDIGLGKQLIFDGGRKPDGFAILDGCCFGSSLITLLLMNVESPDDCAFNKKWNARDFKHFSYDFRWRLIS